MNSIAFHKYGTFATAGSDGNFHFWDKDSRQRLKAFDLKQGNTIPVCKFSPDGGLFGWVFPCCLSSRRVLRGWHVVVPPPTAMHEMVHPPPPSGLWSHDYGHA